MPKLIIRSFERRDVSALLSLMQDLARFEGYFEEFAVQEDDLTRHGLGETPDFKAFVAERDGELIGMAVVYEIPWTYDLKPRLVLKELYVSKPARALGVGKALLRRVTIYAAEIGASQVNWTVLKGNTRAEKFYHSLGGKLDPVWDNWLLDDHSISELAKTTG